MDKALYSELKSFIAERHSAQSQDVAGASDKVGALNATANTRKQQIMAQLPPLQVNVIASASAIPLDTPALLNLPTATEIGTKFAETGASVAEAAPPVAMMAAEAATPMLIGSHLAQKYMEGKHAFEMQQADAAYEALETQDIAKLPPFGNNEPLPPPPLINPDKSEHEHKLSQPITTPAAPPNISIGTPPLANNQPLPPSPPLVTPDNSTRVPMPIFYKAGDKALSIFTPSDCKAVRRAADESGD